VKIGLHYTIAILCAPLFANAPGINYVQAGESGSVSIDYAYLSKLSSLDKGTIHMFVKNSTDKPVTITQVILNDVPLPDQNPLGFTLSEAITTGLDLPVLEDERIIWHDVVPNPIPPYKIANVKIKCAVVPYRLVKVSVRTNDGTECHRVIQPIDNSLRMTCIGFNSQFDRIYVYVENTGNEPLNVTDIFLDTKNVTKATFKPWQTILPKQKQCLVISLHKPLINNEYVAIKVTTEDDLITAASLIKVSSFFPIAMESGEAMSSLNMTSGFYSIEWSRNTVIPGTGNPMYHILDCPMHAFKSLTVAGQTGVSHASDCRYKNPFPTYMDICKAAQEQGGFIFSQIADVIRTNPTEPSSAWSGAINEHPSQQLSRTMKLATSPRPWYAIIRVNPDDRIPEFKSRAPTTDEVRLLVYYSISGGAKGIFYNLSANATRMTEEIKKINTELQLLRRFLVVGEPMPLGKCTEPKVEACTIQAGYDALVLLLINHDTQVLSDPAEPFTYNPNNNFTVTVRIPEGMDIKDVYEIGGTSDNIEYTKTGDEITIPIRQLQLTKQVVLTTNPGGNEYRQSSNRF
jgi:hypothetical protein